MPTSVNGLHIGVKRRPALCYDDFNAKIRAQRSTASACRHLGDGGICMHVPTGAGANRDTRHRSHYHRRRSRRSPNVNTNAHSRTHCYTRYCGHGRCRSIGHHRRRAAHFDTFYYRPYPYPANRLSATRPRWSHRPRLHPTNRRQQTHLPAPSRRHCPVLGRR